MYEHIAPNNKRYYGITKQDPKKRWQNGYGYKEQYFYRAILKYGWNNINHNILKDNMSLEDANFYEKYYINKYKTNNPLFGYNCTIGGDGVISSYNDIVLQKIGNKVVNAFLNKKECARLLNMSNTTIKKYCDDGLVHGGYSFEIIYNYDTNAFYDEYGDLFNEEYFDVKEKVEFEKNEIISQKMKKNKEKMISKYDLNGVYICTYNSKKEAEELLNMYIDMTYRKHGEYLFAYGDRKSIERYKNPKMKTVKQIDKYNNEVIKIYESIKEASDLSGVGIKNISKVLNGINKTAGGFIWEYADEVDNIKSA